MNVRVAPYGQQEQLACLVARGAAGGEVQRAALASAEVSRTVQWRQKPIMSRGQNTAATTQHWWPFPSEIPARPGPCTLCRTALRCWWLEERKKKKKKAALEKQVFTEQALRETRDITKEI